MVKDEMLCRETRFLREVPSQQVYVARHGPLLHGL
jgi:hypothetical protein